MSLAVLIEDARCPLCEERLWPAEDGEVLCLTMMGVGFDPVDREQARMDDSCIHQGCFDRWSRRDDFLNAYNGNTDAERPHPECIVRHEGRWVLARDIPSWRNLANRQDVFLAILIAGLGAALGIAFALGVFVGVHL